MRKDDRDKIDCNAEDKAAGFKNKWRWDWLDEKVDGECVTVHGLVKIREPGFVLCTLCKEAIKYGSGGKNRLIDHITKSTSHKKIFASLRNSSQLPGIC